MIILVINCGSSSIKYQLLDMKNDDVYSLLAKGIVEKIGLECGRLQHTPAGKEKVVKDLPVPDHTVGMQIVLDALIDKDHGVLKSFDDIEAVGHRIVQGADFFSGSAIVDEDVIKKIDFCCDFAPLHNPAHLLGIRACQEVLPSVPQVVTFDTAFHQTMPPYAYMYGLPYEYYDKYHIRRYGAHGTSHQFVAKKGAEMVGLDLNNSRIITCHIGNGASVSAVKFGKCVDTSMGLTPLAGVMMGSRSGDIDPSAVTFLMEKLGKKPQEMADFLNKESGVLGITGISSDMREVESAAAEGNKRAQLALKMYNYRIKKYIGAYAAAMGGVDIIVWTAGVGENQIGTRLEACSGLEFLGVEMDAEANKVRGEEAIISKPESKVTVCVIPTDEELMIAKDTMALLQK